MSELSSKFKLLIISWQTQYFHDGSFRSTKTMNLEFKELPEWFTMDMCEEDRKTVKETPRLLEYIKLQGQLISISLVENKTIKYMMESAAETYAAGTYAEEHSDCCDCECECDCEDSEE